MEYPLLDLKATGERIRKLRIERHIRVEDISSYMGFESPQAVYKWQRGDSLPTVDNLYALSRLFRIPIDNILVPIREEDASLPLHILELSA
ncbi:MAG: helix-turn-helix domain-containing protein [Lachnospiraceae bacterium]|nr:helix-turn-helix domain-containing protein [Lachnospiraceae bacterium]